MQLAVGAGLAGVALTIPTTHFFQYTLVFFWLLAFSSATHDIAADGFYMLATSEREQAFFSGIRNLFYRVAMICGQGMLVILAGRLQKLTDNPAMAWSLALGAAAAWIVCLGVYHGFILPRPTADHPGRPGSITRFWTEFFATFGSYFRKPKLVVLLLFLLLYRLGEAQLVKMAIPFLLDTRDAGGLALTTDQVGRGGLLGGFVVSRHGLKRWLWPMLFAIHLPDVVFIYLAHAQPTDLKVIGACVAVEQFGYGFGFSAFMLYMIYIARGEHATAHYAICTGFMALGMMIPGMWSGWLQEQIGYPHFFEWVLLATIPSFLVTLFIPLDWEFGKKAEPSIS